MPSRTCSGCASMPARMLPKDDEADGFDNVASVLTVSPSFLEQYISAARRCERTRRSAIRRRAPASATYRPARGTDQAVRVEGLPLGTRGGLLVEHLFPADGDYKLNISGLAGAGYVRGMEYRHTLVVTIDGSRSFQGHIGGEDDLKAIDQQQASAVAAINGRFQNIPVSVTAGPHKVGVTFVARTYAESDEVLHSFRPGAGEDRVPRVASLEVVGPFSRPASAITPSRQRIFVCRPASSGRGASLRDKDLSHDRAPRLSPAGDRRTIWQAPLDFYRAARTERRFRRWDPGGAAAILASPKFLYRAERSPADALPGAVHRISDLELASRLSFFLPGRMPDDALLDAAEKGTLGDPKVLEATCPTAACRTRDRSRSSRTLRSSG